MLKLVAIPLATLAVPCLLFSQHWPQGGGPNGRFVAETGAAPVSWSVVRDENIAWKVALPELGQSSVTVWEGKLFFTAHQPVQADATLGRDIVAYCCDAKDGSIIWTRELPGAYPMRIASSFGDSSSPSPVTDSERVCFFNTSGRIECFDLAGNPLWSRPDILANRAQPFLQDRTLIYTQINWPPDENGDYPHPDEPLPPSRWTQLQAIDFQTGDPLWKTECGINMGNVPLPIERADGRPAVLVGRGGGHGPPEHPEGISLVDTSDGAEIWSLPIEGFMSTQTMPVHQGRALVFHDDSHLWVDISDGTVVRQVSLLRDARLRAREGGAWKDEVVTIPPSKKGREITQQSNLLVSDYHYFRSYSRNYLGRINVNTGELEYLQLPVSMRRSSGQADELIWDGPPTLLKELFKVATAPTYWTFQLNRMRNSRGFLLQGDPRSQGNGWGHVASPIPTAIGPTLFVPIMNGMVYAIDWRADRLDERALLSLNDLGPIGHAWTRSSLTYSDGKLYARTIQELICIAPLR